jgi:hypothetical protein
MSKDGWKPNIPSPLLSRPDPLREIVRFFSVFVLFGGFLLLFIQTQQICLVRHESRLFRRNFTAPVKDSLVGVPTIRILFFARNSVQQHQ